MALDFDCEDCEDTYESVETPDNGVDMGPVFAALNRAGIFARQNYHCCNSCGCASVPIDADNELPGARGFCFYHLQDDDRRREGKNFHITFGDINSETEASKKIGEEIVQVLKQHKIKTEWNGNVMVRIKIIQERES